MALPRGFRYYLPLGEVGIAFFFAISGGAKYNPDSYRDGFLAIRTNETGEIPRWLASGVVGSRNFLFKITKSFSILDLK